MESAIAGSQNLNGMMVLWEPKLDKMDNRNHPRRIHPLEKVGMARRKHAIQRVVPFQSRRLEKPKTQKAAMAYNVSTLAQAFSNDQFYHGGERDAAPDAGETMTDNSQEVDLKAGFQKLKDASRRNPAPQWATRKDRLQRLRNLVVAHKEEIADAISLDFMGRARQETLLAEIVPALEEIDHCMAKGRKWMRVKRARTGLNFLFAKSRIVPHPKGVVGIIAPWNYPLGMILMPLIDAITAGNLAMVKISEHVPVFGELMRRLFKQSFSEEEILIVTGGPEVAAEFSSLPFDHIFFTGSQKIGRLVMEAAAKNLAPVTLELGGKSPVIVMMDADIPRSVNSIMRGKTLNAGQTCVAPDYVYVHETVKDEFLKECQKWVKERYGNIANNPSYTHIINLAAYDRLEGMVSFARKLGVNVIPLAGENVEPNREKRFLPPYIIEDMTPGRIWADEEIFGPVLPVVGFKYVEKVVAEIESRPRPLATYLFTNSLECKRRFLHRSISGGMGINETIYHVGSPHLPFGGVGHSGMGNYHGKAGFDTFTHHKSVLWQSPINFTRFFSPPYGDFFESLMRFKTGGK